MPTSRKKRSANVCDCQLEIGSNGPILPSNWKNWGPWESCSKTCGGGTKLRNPICLKGKDLFNSLKNSKLK